MVRQGAHQVVQKSTIVSPEFRSTSCSNVASVTSTVLGIIAPENVVVRRHDRDGFGSRTDGANRTTRQGSLGGSRDLDSARARVHRAPEESFNSRARATGKFSADARPRVGPLARP